MNRILIIGGTGSLGNELVNKYINNNILYILSRDEKKQWDMKNNFKNHNYYHNLNFIIGNIGDYNKMESVFLRYNFNIIILAAAMKHIDICEFETNECLNTNLIGTQNVLNIIENNKNLLLNLQTVCFVSTDKACSPVNVYGMSKALSESLMIEKSKYISNIKFVCVRYGNVLNSRGSIIPLLHQIGQTENLNYNLTNINMTRFIMTLQDSVNLIEYAINNGHTGDIIIPEIKSIKIIDLFEIFSEIYKKQITIGKLRPGEKLLESLINVTQSRRCIKNNNYYHIKPCYININSNIENIDYNSSLNTITKFELKQYLHSLNLITIQQNEIFNIQFPNNFFNIKPYPYFYIDNILDNNFAIMCQNEILNLNDNLWDRYDNPFEKKYTLRDKNNLPLYCSQLFNNLTSDNFLKYLSNIYGYPIYNDDSKNWWGIHKYINGDKLDIHLDAGIHPINKMKKQLTLGIYLSKNWNDKNGGHLEIWESNNDNSELKSISNKILPKFNRLVIFDNTDNSWHGNPHPVICNDSETRIFLTLSYLSNNHNYNNKKLKAQFIKHPDEKNDEYKEQLRLMRADPNKCQSVYNIK